MNTTGFISIPFGALMDGFIKRAGLRNSDVAERLGVSPPTWVRYKKKPRTIPLGVFQDLVKILKLTDEEVLEVSRSWH